MQEAGHDDNFAVEVFLFLVYSHTGSIRHFPRYFTRGFAGKASYNVRHIIVWRFAFSRTGPLRKVQENIRKLSIHYLYCFILLRVAGGAVASPSWQRAGSTGTPWTSRGKLSSKLGMILWFVFSTYDDRNLELLMTLHKTEIAVCIHVNHLWSSRLSALVSC